MRRQNAAEEWLFVPAPLGGLFHRSTGLKSEVNYRRLETPIPHTGLPLDISLGNCARLFSQ